MLTKWHIDHYRQEVQKLSAQIRTHLVRREDAELMTTLEATMMRVLKSCDRDQEAAHRARSRKPLPTLQQASAIDLAVAGWVSEWQRDRNELEARDALHASEIATLQRMNAELGADLVQAKSQAFAAASALSREEQRAKNILTGLQIAETEIDFLRTDLIKSRDALEKSRAHYVERIDEKASIIDRLKRKVAKWKKR